MRANKRKLDELRTKTDALVRSRMQLLEQEERFLLDQLDTTQVSYVDYELAAVREAKVALSRCSGRTV